MPATSTLSQRITRHFAAVQRDHQQWRAGLTALRAFRAEHGHSAVPPGYIHDGFPLSAWLTALRTDRRQTNPALTRARIADLDALGMRWN